MIPRDYFPWRAVAAGGLVLGTIGVLALVVRRPKEMAGRRVALIGDSYAVGLGPELAKLMPDFRGEGRIGAGTSSYRLPPWLAEFRPTIALVSLGVNDGARPNPANYQAIVQTLHGLGARVMWIEPPAGVNAPAVRTAIASLGVSTAPAPALTMAPDRLHPTSAGYAAWAREIAAAAT